MLDLLCACDGDNIPDDRVPVKWWREFPNVTYWDYDKSRPMSWDSCELGSDGWGNTLPFALQVAWLLGFKRVHFAGVGYLNEDNGWGNEEARRVVRKRINDMRERSPLEWPELEVG